MKLNINWREIGGEATGPKLAVLLFNLNRNKIWNENGSKATGPKLIYV